MQHSASGGGFTGAPPLPSGAATEATLASILTSVSGLSLAQGSTTSGQPGVLSFGAVTTSAPSYTNGQSSPLSLMTFGALRTAIVDGSGAQITSFGGGVQYTEGDVDASITGTAVMWEDTSDTLRAVSAAKPLPVNIVAGSSSGTEYTEGAAAATNPAGGALIAVSISSPSAEVTSGQNVALRATPKGELYVSSVIDQNLITLSDSVTSGTVIPAGSFLMGFKSGTSQWARVRMEADNADGIAVDTMGHLQVLGHTLGFNGTSWDRIRGDVSNGLDVDVTRVQGTVAISVAAGASTIAKAEDVASADADVGVPAMAVRKATPANTSGTDGDYEMLQMSAGRLWTSAIIDTALPSGTNAIGKLAANSGVTIGAVEIAASQTLATVTSLTQMNGQAIAMGTGVRSAGTQRVTIATDDLVPVSLAAGASSIGKAEDSASADLDVGVPAMAVRKATPANTSGTDGDYEMLQMSAGRLWASAVIDTALPAGTNAIGKLAANSGVDIGDVDVTSIIPGTGATNLGKAEDAVAGSGDVGVMALAVRADTAAATAANGDYVPLLTDSEGKLHITKIQSDRVATPTLSNVAGSATSVTILSSNTSRRQVVLVNDSSAICYVKFGATASTTSYTVQMPAIANNQAAHLFLDENPIYTGRIDAIWASATGSMRVTEIAT